MKDDIKITLKAKWLEILNQFDSETRIAVFGAILEYMTSGEVPQVPATAQMAFLFIKDKIDAAARRREKAAQRRAQQQPKQPRPKIYKQVMQLYNRGISFPISSVEPFENDEGITTFVLRGPMIDTANRRYAPYTLQDLEVIQQLLTLIPARLGRPGPLITS